MASPIDVCDPSWYIDSGATHYVAAELDNPRNLNDYKWKGKLVIGNSEGMNIS